ncbi:hypothetical protein QL285_028399 [Trifolium repens]|nr:hypothetical protein QL285_028399 [Trifolium repens]
MSVGIALRFSPTPKNVVAIGYCDGKFPWYSKIKGTEENVRGYRFYGLYPRFLNLYPRNFAVAICQVSCSGWSTKKREEEAGETRSTRGKKRRSIRWKLR